MWKDLASGTLGSGVPAYRPPLVPAVDQWPQANMVAQVVDMVSANLLGHVHVIADACAVHMSLTAALVGDFALRAFEALAAKRESPDLLVE